MKGSPNARTPVQGGRPLSTAAASALPSPHAATPTRTRPVIASTPTTPLLTPSVSSEPVSLLSAAPLAPIAGPPLPSSAPLSVYVDLTQTPNRLHHQFRQFTRSHADADGGQMSPFARPPFDSPSPVPLSSRTWAPRSSLAPNAARQRGLGHPELDPTSSSHGAALAAAGDLHLYLDYIRSLRSPAAEDDSRQRSRLVGNFHSLRQETSLQLQQQQLLTQTIVTASLTAAEMRAHQATVVGLADTSHLAIAAREVVTDVHRLPMDALQRQLGTDFRLGLDAEEVRKRQAQFGLNVLTPPPSPSMVLLLLRELVTGFGPILWVAALLCFLAWRPFGSPPDPTNLGLAVIIIAVIVLSSFFAFYQTQKSISIITAFSRILPSFAMVRRGGREQSVLASDLVPGDVVTIKLGDKVPADVRVLSCDSLQVNNSALTGESEAVSCTVEATSDNVLESSNVCFYSSLVISGAATAVVLNTGDRTVLGHVSALTKTDSSHSTNLQNEIRRFVWIICSLAVSTAIVCLIAWVAWLRVDHFTFLPTSSFLTNVIGLVVAYLPTGLPISLSLVLTFVARRMYQQHILCKNLSIVEDFNSVSIILSDKTGTLTLNQLTAVNALWGREGRLTVPMSAEKEDPFLHSPTFLHPVVQSMLHCSLLCNAVEVIEQSGDPHTEEVKGDAVDVALHQLGRKCQVDLADKRKRHPRVRVLPFNSRHKFMVAVHQVEATDPEQLLAIIKGAPEFVTRKCTRWTDDSGEEVELTEERRSIIFSLQEAMGHNGYRVIAIAQQRLTLGQLTQDKQAEHGVPHSGYTYLGLFCFIDPPRPGVPAAVTKSHGAGIRVCMVTGDHPSTAVAIAKQVNILRPHERLDTCEVHTDAGGRWTVNIHRDGQLLDTHAIGGVIDNADQSPSPSPSSSSHVAPLSSLFDAQRPVSSTSASADLLAAAPPPVPAAASAFNGGQWVDDGSAAECGIIVTGSDLRSFDVAMWDFCLRHGSMVFARTSPEQKLKIVAECQRRGEIVALTGDGVNDAPSMKRADVGVAMQAGAEVAQEAADIILLDNSFPSIVTAIETGRLLSDNVKKVLLYLLPAGSFSEILPILANFFLGLPLPLSAFLMIVVCMLTDLCPSLALVKESAESDIMKRRPQRRSAAHLVNWRLLFHAYALLGVIESCCAFLCWFWYFHEHGFPASSLFLAFDSYTDGYRGYTQAQLDDLLYTGQSIFFVSLVIMQFFNLLSTRTRYVSFFAHPPFHGPSRNLWLFAAMSVSTLIAITITQVHAFNDLFHTRPVPVKYVMPALGFGGFLFLFDETRKRFVQRYPTSTAAWLAW